MATTQIWTLADSTRDQSVDDILSPHIRYPLVTDRRTPVFKNKLRQYGIAKDKDGNPIANQDNVDFLNWLRIRNHVLSRAGKPVMEPNVESALLFMEENKSYKYHRAFRFKKKTA